MPTTEVEVINLPSRCSKPGISPTQLVRGKRYTLQDKRRVHFLLKATQAYNERGSVIIGLPMPDGSILSVAVHTWQPMENEDALWFTGATLGKEVGVYSITGVFPTNKTQAAWIERTS